MESAQQKSNWAKTILSVTFCVALVLNLIDALWQPDGQPWLILRIAVSILFGLALMGYIALCLRHHRSDAAG